ncbi:hypothetical protein ACKTG8_003206 [Cronobacter sakazakii]|uniref:hypothetical protein n=2 Tax=Cronobacter sakazakii TaxID=28141 RepID=UPI0005C920AD|nr:hypothetical protein [Cronobacter sakazakii]EGT5762269.1 hypothetical protein [Cronobacter sakazakii]EIX1613621.1 hypothetical protein [Cronobacter sakazakii]EJG0760125.1 hypothetical protein [Cronobacter sakazakii]EKK3984217.1 hypothetical protein [Cronobacter sakazakii]EKK4013330.1 hypothetical protein [Cronobacter sakazakii]
MKKVVMAIILGSFLTGCAPGYVYTPPSKVEYDKTMQEAKRKDAEFAEKVKNINLDTADVGVKPKDYQSLVESAIREGLKDPDSAKFYDFTSPRKEVMVEQGDFVYGYSTCVYVNAKNSYGGYVGKQLYWAFIRNNQVLRVTNTAEAYGDIIFVGRPITC